MSLRRRERTESTTQILDDNDSNSLTNRKKNLRKFLRVSLAINGVLIVVLLVLFIIKTRLYEQDKKVAKSKDVSYKASSSKSGVCLPCDSLGPGVKAEDTLFDSIRTTEHGEHGGKICCYREQPYLQIMISRMMNPQITKPIPETDDVINKKMEWWRSRKNSIHMYLNVNQLGGNDLVWSVSDDYLGTAYMNNMKYNGTNNSIELQDSGIFFIYSAITFDFGDVTSVELHNYELIKWHRLLPRTKTELLKSRFGGSSETKRIYTSFLCGAFKLEKGTNVKIKMSNETRNHVKKSKYANYIGLFKV